MGSAGYPPNLEECYCTEPLLSLAIEKVYWGSVADYQNRILSVDFDISNNSENYANAHNLQILGTTNTAGVISVDQGRIINMVSAGECELVTLKYSVPEGVGSFRTNLHATTNDQCGNSYSYGGPMT